MPSGPDRSWLVRVEQAESLEALGCLMDRWYEEIKSAGGLHNSIGFDAYMERRDWESAKRSIERTYGSSSPEHRSALDTLGAASGIARRLGEARKAFEAQARH